MRIASLLLTLAVFALQSVQAGPSCEPSRLDHEALKDRSWVITFPDGWTITLIGHHHGDPEDLDALAEWATTPVAETPTAEWMAQMDQFLQEQARTEQHAKEDLAFLRTTLWTSPDPIFVALEASDESIEGRINRAQGLKRNLARQICDREIQDPTALREAELVAMGATIYSYLHEPELRARYDLVGVEGGARGGALQRRGKKTMEIAEARLAEVAREHRLDAATVRPIMEGAVEELNAAYLDSGLIFIHDHEAIRETVESAADPDPELRGAVLSYLFGYLDFLRGMKRRDLAFIHHLARQDRSGVFFVGEEHLDSIAGLLEIPCSRGNSRQSMLEWGAPQGGQEAERGSMPMELPIDPEGRPRVRGMTRPWD
jgi:hypothetical protein